MEMVVLAALLGLATTSSSMLGVALGLYVPLSKRLLGCLLAFAGGGLIRALAIDRACRGNRRRRRARRGDACHDPEAIEEAGSAIVLPTTAGFLAALYSRWSSIPSAESLAAGRFSPAAIGAWRTGILESCLAQVPKPGGLRLACR